MLTPGGAGAPPGGGARGGGAAPPPGDDLPAVVRYFSNVTGSSVAQLRIEQIPQPLLNALPEARRNRLPSDFAKIARGGPTGSAIADGTAEMFKTAAASLQRAADGARFGRINVDQAGETHDQRAERLQKEMPQDVFLALCNRYQNVSGNAALVPVEELPQPLTAVMGSNGTLGTYRSAFQRGDATTAGDALVGACNALGRMRQSRRSQAEERRDNEERTANQCAAEEAEQQRIFQAAIMGINAPFGDIGTHHVVALEKRYPGMTFADIQAKAQTDWGAMLEAKTQLESRVRSGAYDGKDQEDIFDEFSKLKALVPMASERVMEDLLSWAQAACEERGIEQNLTSAAAKVAAAQASQAAGRAAMNEARAILDANPDVDLKEVRALAAEMEGLIGEADAYRAGATAGRTAAQHTMALRAGVAKLGPAIEQGRHALDSLDGELGRAASFLSEASKSQATGLGQARGVAANTRAVRAGCESLRQIYRTLEHSPFKTGWEAQIQTAQQRIVTYEKRADDYDNQAESVTRSIQADQAERKQLEGEVGRRQETVKAQNEELEEDDATLAHGKETEEEMHQRARAELAPLVVAVHEELDSWTTDDAKLHGMTEELTEADWQIANELSQKFYGPTLDAAVLSQADEEHRLKWGAQLEGPEVTEEDRKAFSQAEIQEATNTLQSGSDSAILSLFLSGDPALLRIAEANVAKARKRPILDIYGEAFDDEELSVIMQARRGNKNAARTAMLEVAFNAFLGTTDVDTLDEALVGVESDDLRQIRAASRQGTVVGIHANLSEMDAAAGALPGQDRTTYADQFHAYLADFDPVKAVGHLAQMTDDPETMAMGIERLPASDRESAGARLEQQLGKGWTNQFDQGWERDLVQAVVAQDDNKARAARIRGAIEGKGTDEDGVFDNMLGGDQAAIDKAYQELYGVSLKDDLKGDLDEVELVRAQGIIDNGGQDRPAAAVFYAVSGPGTGEKLLKSTMGKSKEEIQQMREDWNANFAAEYGADFDSMIEQELGGAEYFEVMILKEYGNNPSTQEKVEIMQKRHAFQRTDMSNYYGSGLMDALSEMGLDDSAETFDRQQAELGQYLDAKGQIKPGMEDEVEDLFVRHSSSAVAYETSRDAVAEAIATGVEITVGLALTVATAGSAAPVLMAIASSAIASAAGLATEVALKGQSMSSGEIAGKSLELILAVGLAGAGHGAGVLLDDFAKKMGTSAANSVAKEMLKNATAGAIEGLGDGVMDDSVTSVSEWLAARGAGAVQGAAVGVVGGVASDAAEARFGKRVGETVGGATESAAGVAIDTLSEEKEAD